MKNFYLLLFSLVVMLSACSKDDPTDFVGSYDGDVLCTDEQLEMTSFVITLNSDETYTLNIEDEASFIGTAEDNVLTIESQRPLGGGTFEPLFMGTFVENEDGTFTLAVVIDDGGDVYSCTATMTKN